MFPMGVRALAIIAAACLLVRFVSVSLSGRMFLGGSPEIATPHPQSQDTPVLLVYYCGGCHRAGRSGLDFDRPPDFAAFDHGRSGWQKALQYLRDGDMPPPGKPQPSAQERATLIAWIELGLSSARARAVAPVVFRRLKRIEYQNAIRDLLGVEFRPGVGFPADDSGWSMGAALPRLSAVHQAQYEAAARHVLAAWPATALPEGLTWDQALDLVVPIAERAYRRPLESADIEQLMAALANRPAEGANAVDANIADRIKDALQTALTSPHFLLVSERRDSETCDSEARDSAIAPGSSQAAFALAARLSFFLWRSLPDAELLAAARRKMLPAQLGAHVTRMLQDRRADAFIAAFTDDWLELDKLRAASLPHAALRQSMLQETHAFFSHVMRADRPILDFLEADYTFLNEELARHYGVDSVLGDSLRQVALRGTKRGGVLFQASVLTLTSAAGETSPVRRGKWVLDNLLGDTPGPPPAGAARTARLTTTFTPGTLRQLLARHRADAACVQCHARMDAIGLALENYDARGAWRVQEGVFPVEAIGELSGGRALIGHDGLRAYLREKQADFVRCLAGKLLSHALGRKLDSRDQAVIQEVSADAARHNHRFSSLMIALVNSASFCSPWSAIAQASPVTLASPQR